MGQIWILQSNLARHEEETIAFIEALQALVIHWATVPLLPFETEMRAVYWDGPRVYVGSTNLVRNISRDVRAKDPVFFNDATFRPSVWGRKFGEAYLNSDAKFTTIEAFLNDLPSEPVFIRPDADLKSFTGQVIEPKEAEKWLSEQSHGYHTFTTSLPIVVASEKLIWTETRVWMVDQVAVAAVMYRKDGKRCIVPIDLGEAVELKQFAERTAVRHSPAEVFVLDVAETPNGRRAIEVNSFHCSGIYSKAMALPIVREVSNFVAANYTLRGEE